MIAVFALALTLITPWVAPLSFEPQSGWHTGTSGTFTTVTGQSHTPQMVSDAFAANFPYTSSPRADPPVRTLQRIPKSGVVIWASITSPTTAGWPPDNRRLSTKLTLADSYHFACCDAVPVVGGESELYAFGPNRKYDVLVRVYWGSRATPRMKAEANEMLSRLKLPRTVPG
jgi:hypothetical protein